MFPMFFLLFCFGTALIFSVARTCLEDIKKNRVPTYLYQATFLAQGFVSYISLHVMCVSFVWTVVKELPNTLTYWCTVVFAQKGSGHKSLCFTWAVGGGELGHGIYIVFPLPKKYNVCCGYTTNIKAELAGSLFHLVTLEIIWIKINVSRNVCCQLVFGFFLVIVPLWVFMQSTGSINTMHQNHVLAEPCGL